MELTVVPITKPDAANFIFGQSHFIKTVEDLHEALVGAVPGIRFGLAFCEASGKRLVRWSGNDEPARATLAVASCFRRDLRIPVRDGDEFQEQQLISHTEFRGSKWLDTIGLNPTLEAASVQLAVVLFAAATFLILQYRARSIAKSGVMASRPDH